MTSAQEPPSLIVRAGLRLPARARVAAFLDTLQTRVARGRTFSCLLTDDAELRRLNRRFRRKNQATDVLSFPAGAPAGPLGDIAISLDRAREQARVHGHAAADEVCILALHGLLHLRGMDHETDAGAMRRAELAWRRKLDLPAGLIERAEA